MKSIIFLYGSPLDLCRNLKNGIDFPDVLWCSIEDEDQRTAECPSALRDYRGDRSHTVRRAGQDLHWVKITDTAKGEIICIILNTFAPFAFFAANRTNKGVVQLRFLG